MQWSFWHTSQLPRQELDRAYRQLTPSRKAHIDSLHKQADKDRSLAGELLVQKLLRRHYGITDAQLHRAANGAPYLTGCDLFVSISHSADMVVCAVSEHPVGIDVEKLRPVDLRMARHICTPEELSYLLEGKALPAGGGLCEDPAAALRFFEIWTAKEAYFKKQGTGITNLRSVNILPLRRYRFTPEGYLVQIVV